MKEKCEGRRHITYICQTRNKISWVTFSSSHLSSSHRLPGYTPYISPLFLSLRKITISLFLPLSISISSHSHFPILISILFPPLFLHVSYPWVSFIYRTNLLSLPCLYYGTQELGINFKPLRQGLYMNMFIHLCIFSTHARNQIPETQSPNSCISFNLIHCNIKS